MIDFRDDEPEEMSIERRWALSMIDKPWYNPNAEGSNAKGSDTRSLAINDNDDDDDGAGSGNFRSKDGYTSLVSKETKPLLRSAWEFFDHVALPRHYVDQEEEEEEGKERLAGEERKSKKKQKRSVVEKLRQGNIELTRAKPGDMERKTKLYDPIFTPHAQLGDFGIGVGLYFSALRYSSFIFIVLGLVLIPLIVFYGSEEYSEGQTGLNWIYQGSAICTNDSWVPCPLCRTDNSLPVCRSKDNGMTFARKHDCKNIIDAPGISTVFAILFLIAITTLLLLAYYLRKSAKSYDEDEQTAQDYSIVIKNPPADAKDPEEWREFFQTQFEVTVVGCTVGVNNDSLVRALVDHRQNMRLLELSVPPGTKLDTVHIAKVASQVALARSSISSLLANVIPGIPEYFQNVLVAKGKVQGLTQQPYSVTNVFMTFETEADQRKVLEVFDFGAIHISANNRSILSDPKHLFRNDNLLDIDEASEPDAILWDAVNVNLKTKIKQYVISNGFLIIAVFIVAAIVHALSEYSILVTLTITISGQIYGFILPITTAAESHSNINTEFVSIYFKLAIFRIVTTSLLAYITPFSLILDSNGGIALKVFSQFQSEILMNVLLDFFDIFGIKSRHYDAPRAKSQEAMNICMLGSDVTLAVKYTNMSNLIVLAFWSCVLFPEGFFWCALCLFANYFIDKYCLMRTWKRQPKVGSFLSNFYIQFFYPLAMLVLFFFTVYFIAGFPFDNLCETSEIVPSSYIGNWSTKLWEKEGEQSFINKYFQNKNVVNCEPIKISEGEMMYKYCHQGFRNLIVNILPWFENDSKVELTETQLHTATIIVWSSFGWIVCYSILFTIRYIMLVRKFFMGKMKTKYFSFCNGSDDKGREQPITFSEAGSCVSLYIPQVSTSVYSCPLLACHVDNVDKSMIDWQDTEHPHSFYDLQKDAEMLVGSSNSHHDLNINTDDSFSTVTHWPPTQRSHSILPKFDLIRQKKKWKKMMDACPDM